MNQIAYSNNPLRNIDEAHCRALVKSFGTYSYNYARGKMKIYFSSIFSAERAVLKDDYCIAMLVGSHWRRSITTLQIEKGMQWVLAPLRLRHPFRFNNMKIPPSKAIKQSKISNVSKLLRYARWRLQTRWRVCEATLERPKRAVAYASLTFAYWASWNTGFCPIFWVTILDLHMYAALESARWRRRIDVGSRLLKGREGHSCSEDRSHRAHCWPQPIHIFWGRGPSYGSVHERICQKKTTNLPLFTRLSIMDSTGTSRMNCTLLT